MRRLGRLFVLALIVGAGLLIWKPEWRRPTFEFARTLVVKGIELARRQRKPAAPTPVREAASNAPAPAPAAESDQSASSPSDASSSSDVEENHEEPVGPTGNLSPTLPALGKAPALPDALRSLQKKAESGSDASAYRRLADRAVALGFAEVAARAYQKEADLYQKQGDPNAAAVERLKAGRYRTEAKIYLDAPAAVGPPASLAPLEPAAGVLLGAFIDRDDQLTRSFMDENSQTHREPEQFAERVGKKHASLFCYLQYGRPFPVKWAERLRSAGVVPHLAWEPSSLEEVTEGSLAPFADSLAEFDSPVFIRFAGEMNGEWTPYHDDPALYRQKFRLVYRVLKARAPKCALIWCANSVPLTGLDAYYPGDDAVDWVGVNLYNVLFFDNDPQRSGTGVHPADLLSPIYDRYAARKPIAICEYAASHRASVDPKGRADFAALRMSQLYAALPRIFPRVKLIDWFDCDNLIHAREGRQLNDYSLTDDSTVERAYREAIAPPVFLSGAGDTAPSRPVELREGQPVSGIVSLSAWVRTYTDRPRVYLLGDGLVLHAGEQPGPYACRWDTRKLSPGTHELRLVVLDEKGRVIRDVRQRVVTTG